MATEIVDIENGRQSLIAEVDMATFNKDGPRGGCEIEAHVGTCLNGCCPRVGIAISLPDGKVAAAKMSVEDGETFATYILAECAKLKGVATN